MNILKKLYPPWLKKKPQPKKTLRQYRFEIKYKNLIVGELYTQDEDGKQLYCFKYSKAFEDQHSKENAVRKITGFKTFKTYKSESLYPFFISRIPDPNRPIIREIIKKDKIDESDPLAILAHFGKKTLDNTFTVELKE